MGTGHGSHEVQGNRRGIPDCKQYPLHRLTLRGFYARSGNHDALRPRGEGRTCRYKCIHCLRTGNIVWRRIWKNRIWSRKGARCLVELCAGKECAPSNRRPPARDVGASKSVDPRAKLLERENRMIEEILFGGADSRPRTIVSIQSVSLGGLTSRYLRGLNYFEERNFYFIDLLRNRNCGCVADLSDDIDNRFFEHAMHEGARACNLDPGDIARRWKTLFVPTDGRSSLSELLLRNPHALGWLREILARCENPILDFWTVSEHEIQLANALGLPHFGLREEFLSIDSKSNGRAIFELLKIRHPRGRQNIHSVDDAQRALADLSSGSDARSFLIKLNCEEAGNGIARVQRSVVGESRDKFIAHLEISKKIPLEAFVSQIGRQRAVVEECIEAPITSFPSGKMNGLPDGQVVNLATHDQVLTGMAYSGSRFPANEEYRKELIARGYEIAAYLAAKGVRGMVSVDFIATRERATEPWKVWGLEINARSGATTHPYL